MAITTAVEKPVRGVSGVLRAISRPSLLALGVAMLALLSALFTYAILTGLTPFEATPTRLTSCGTTVGPETSANWRT